MSHEQIVSLAIFVITYIGIIFTTLPWINIDRPSAAFFGAVAMIIFGIMPFEEAIRAVDFNTIALLLGMMIIIITLELDGFFSFIARKSVSIAGNQRRLLWIIVIVTGVSSAFLVNDAVVLLFTPVVIAICRSSKLSPMPYLIAEILSANAGSAMTITGNPQNMLIGMQSGIPYGTFMLCLLPVSLLSMATIVAVVRIVYAGHFRKIRRIGIEEDSFQYNYASMKTSVPIFMGVLVLFFFSHRFGIPIPVIALAGSALVLIFGRIRPSTIIKDIDWVLLVFFASLFIVVKGFEKSGLMDFSVLAAYLDTPEKGIVAVHGTSLALSQVISNVPLVVAVLPVLTKAGSWLLWLALASASTLAGNATIIGAMANLIVIESARKEGVRISFMEFLKSGLPCTVITLMISMIILWIESFFIPFQ